MPVKACVIGAGHLGQHHARIYADLNNVELASVVDLDENKAREIASRYGTKPFTDYRDAIGLADVASIVSPTSTHFEIAMDCLKAGLDVLVEKPITVSVREADALIEEAEKGGRVLQVGHLERYNPAVMEAASLISGLEFIESERVSPFLGRATDVDVTHDLMIHDIDIIMSLTGGHEVKDIKVVGAKVLTDKIDVAKAWLEFDNGVAALITASRISRETKRLLKIYQRESFILLDYQARTINRFTTGEQGISAETLSVEDAEPLMSELEDFIDCVAKRRRPMVSGVEGRRALDVAIKLSDKIRGVHRADDTDG